MKKQKVASGFPPAEKQTAVPAGDRNGGKTKEKAFNLQAEDYFSAPLDAIALPQVRAAFERDRLARELLGLPSNWRARP